MSEIIEVLVFSTITTLKGMFNIALELLPIYSRIEKFINYCYKIVTIAIFRAFPLFFIIKHTKSKGKNNKS